MEWIDLTKEEPEMTEQDSLGYKYMQSELLFVKLTFLDGRIIKFAGHFTIEHKKSVHPIKVSFQRFIAGASCSDDFAGYSSNTIKKEDIKNVMWLKELT